MIGSIKRKALIGLTLMAMIMCALTIFGETAYAAGTITDEEGYAYNSIYHAVNSLNDGDSIILTVNGDVPAGYAAGVVLQVNKNVDITILSGSYDAAIDGGISINGGGKLTFGRSGETHKLSMDGQITVNYGDLELNSGLNMHITGTVDACILADSWDTAKPANVRIDGCKFSTDKCNHGIHLRGPGTHADYIKNSEIINNKLRTDHSLFVENEASIGTLENVTIKGDRYALCASTEATIESIKNCDIEASVTALSLSGKIGTISDSTITNLNKYNEGSVSSDYSRYSAIRVLSSADKERGIDKISNCQITSNGNHSSSAGIFLRGTSEHQKTYINTIEDCDIVINGIGRGIYETGNAAYIGTVKDGTIEAKDTGIRIETGGVMGEILSTEIEVAGGSFTSYSYGISCAGGSIERIAQGSHVTVEAPEAVGVTLTNGTVGEIKDIEIDIAGGTGAYGIAMVRSTVETIEGCTIDASGTGRLYGIYNQPGAIDYLKDTAITVNGQGTSGTCVYQQGPTKEVSGCVFIAKGNPTGGYGYNIVNTDPNYPARLDLMKDTTSIAWGYALAVQQDATLGVLSGNHFYSDYGEYGSIYLSVGGVIEDIKSGTYASKGSGVFIRYETSPGPFEVYSGELKKISYENVEADGKTIKQGPVFYGETGWAINANTQGPAPTINVEKEQLEEDQPPNGYARYYGGASKTGSLGNGDAIIGTGDLDRDTDLDNYPESYFMSRTGTDSSVSDDVLKSFAGIDISGKTFHYLTLPITVTYDANGGEGDMSDKDYTGEYRSDLKAETNLFTKDNYKFAGWNTKADGSGTAYQPRETIDITEAEMTLYAQWKKNDSPAPEKYTITYDLNGGEYNGSTADITEEHGKGTTIKIHAAPTREGYTFLYWKGSEYQPGDEYTVTEDHTFTAQWKKNATADDPDDTDNDNPDKKTSSRKSASTGDETNLIYLMALLFVSAGTFAGLVYRHRKAE